MKTKHTYAIKKFVSGIEVKSRKATEFEVEVEWPKDLNAMIAEVGAERIYSMFTGFCAAHHVQSKVKGAFGGSVEKDFEPSADQLALQQAVKNGTVLNGVDFIPAERGSGDSARVKKLRKAAEDGKLTPDLIVSIARSLGDTAVTELDVLKGYGVEELVELTKAWEARQKATDPLAGL